MTYHTRGTEKDYIHHIKDVGFVHGANRLIGCLFEQRMVAIASVVGQYMNRMVIGLHGPIA